MTAALFLLLLSAHAWLVSAETAEQQLNEVDGDLTDLQETIVYGWKDSASYRGTADILWSCLVTLTACVYTAMHMNIPARHRSTWVHLGAKLKWTAITLIAPEWVLHTAFSQFMSASKLCKRLNAQFDTPKCTHDGNSYGFWVVMGGFIVDTSSIHDSMHRMTLTAEGVSLLAREGYFLEMPETQISDRSKANILAKVLVCIQIIWMLIQCIARKIAGYPLTLLEIHTMVHVLCALCIYVMWIKKPLDVEEPVMINSERFIDLIALMVMESPHAWDRRFNSPKETLYLESYSDQQKEEASILPVQSGVDENGRTAAPTVLEYAPFTGTIPEENVEARENAIVTLRSGQGLECGIGPRIIQRRRPPESTGYQISLSMADMQRWELTASALKRLPTFPHRSPDGHLWDWWNTNFEGCDEGLSTGASNFRENKYLIFLRGKGSDWRPSAIAQSIISSSRYTSWLLPLVYGGVHLTAWNFAFPSSVESLLWKIACIGIMGGIPLLMWSTLIVEILESVAAWALRIRPLGLTVGSFEKSWTRESIHAPMLLFYGLCRIYIIVEAFVSLRTVPLGVFAAVPWVQSLPHI